MAEPLQFDYAKQDPRAAIRERLQNAPLEHAEAVLAFYQLLQQAQDHGILDAMRGVMVAGDTIVGRLAEYADTPESIRAMRNLMSLTLLLGQLDPQVLGALTKGTQQSTSEDNPDMQRPPGMFAILRRLFSEDARRGLVAAVSILATFGRTLRPKSGVPAKRP